MSELKRIWLQPECCANNDGRMWCEHDEPVECPDGEPWVEYVRADEITRLRTHPPEEQVWHWCLQTDDWKAYPQLACSYCGSRGPNIHTLTFGGDRPNWKPERSPEEPVGYVMVPTALIQTEWPPPPQLAPGNERFDAVYESLLAGEPIREPITVRTDTWTVIDGCHRITAARMLGIDRVPVRFWTGTTWVPTAQSPTEVEEQDDG